MIPLLQDLHSRDVLVLAHDLGVLSGSVRDFTLTTDPTYQDSLHVSRLNLEGKNLDGGQEQL